MRHRRTRTHNRPNDRHTIKCTLANRFSFSIAHRTVVSFRFSSFFFFFFVWPKITINIFNSVLVAQPCSRRRTIDMVAAGRRNNFFFCFILNLFLFSFFFFFVTSKFPLNQNCTKNYNFTRVRARFL